MLTIIIHGVGLQHEKSPARELLIFIATAARGGSSLPRSRHHRARASKMTTLYRTPNVIIDRHEWHVAVVKHYGRASVRYCWRPLSARAERWQSIAAWEGPKPKDIGKTFWRFRGHVREAMESEQARAQALVGAKRTLGGTPVRQVGRKDPHHHGLGLASVA